MASKPASVATPTIRQRLTALGLIALCPVFFGLVVEGWYQRADDLKQAGEMAVAEVQLATAAQQKQINAVQEMLAGLASGAEGWARSPDCDARFRSLLGELKTFANLGWLDAGDVLSCSAVGSPERIWVGDRQYVREARATKHMSASEMLVGRASGKRSILFGYPMHDAAGRYTGLMFASYKDENFVNLRLAGQARVFSRFSYFDRQGNLITTDPRGSPPIVERLPADAMRRADGSGYHPLVGTTQDRDGGRHVTALAAVYGPNGPVAYVQAGIPEEEVLQAWRNEVLIRFAIVIATMVAGLALTGWFLERWLVRDLKRMVDFTRKASSAMVEDWPVRARTREARQAMVSVVALTQALQEQREQLTLLHKEANATNVLLENKRIKLSQALARLETLSLELVGAQERERKHLARELHDEFGQRLTALNLSLHALEPDLPHDKARKTWSQAETDVADLIRQVRELSVSLRPPALDYFPLETALRQLIDRQLCSAGLDSTMDFAGIPARLPEPLAITAYRLVQEGLTNVLRHAQASRVAIEVNGGEHGNELELILRDNGRGFDHAANIGQRRSSPGCGLLGMQERVELLGGQFHVESVPGQGTRIHAILPIRHASEQTIQSPAG
ncbi:histidine kinase [Noviherbaspirillum galbum]|uniref:histidine kinase n=1 Tax=Noviherbaspirillum galbum TaxID=2709383 RepID=A0A6B3SI94_9BURK|nr:histidine kinase [Noviherbaspirillum galbum]NEX60567.1 hypothetical protein [Noviherbaspirillum galbum]